MITFHHNKNEYRAECLSAPVYVFFVKRSALEGYTRLFSTVIQGRVTAKTCIQELNNRAAQRASALNNTFHLEGI